MYEIDDRVLYTQPRQLHSMFLPPGRTYTGTIISVCDCGQGYVTYRIKLDIKWGHTEEDRQNNSHVNPRRRNENVVLGNVHEGNITEGKISKLVD